MKINHHKTLNKKYHPELHFFISIPDSDVEKHSDDIFEKVAEEFVKYAKEIKNENKS